MKVFLISVLFLSSVFSYAKLVEKIETQVGSNMLSYRDIQTFKQALNQNLIPPSFLLSTLYKTPSALTKSQSKIKEYLLVREMTFQKIPVKLLQNIPKARLNQLLKKTQGSISQKNFLKKLKTAAFPSLKSYLSFLEKDLQIEFFLRQTLMSRLSVSEQDIQSAYFTKHKQKLFSDFEYEFVSVSFNEDKKPLVLTKLKQNPSRNLQQIAIELGLEAKNSKLKGHEIQTSIKTELEKLSVSQISPILLIGPAYYILQIKWKSPLIGPQQQQRKAEIEQQLYSQKLERELKEWITLNKNQTFIKSSSL